MMNCSNPPIFPFIGDGGRVIRMGGKIVELSYVGMNHSDSTLVLRLPQDQLIFLEIDYLKADKGRGMNVSVVTTAKTDEEARKLLQFLAMPFRQN